MNKINYQMRWDSEGTVYRQTVKVPESVIYWYNKYVDEELKALNSKMEHNYSELQELMYLKPIKHNRGLKLTESWRLYLVMQSLGEDVKRFLFDRNTFVEILF